MKIFVFLSLHSRYGCGASSSGFPAALDEAFVRPLADRACTPSLPHIQAQDLEADGFELFPSRDQWALSTVTTHIAQNLVLI